MKRIAFVFALILVISMTYAQKGKVTSALGYVDSGKLDKAFEAIKPALEHGKTKDWPKTYYVLGRVYQAIGTTDNPEFKKLYNGDALADAFENYKKAVEIDPKKKYSKQVDIQYLSITGQFINRGVEQFQAEKFEEAMKSFEYSLEVGKMPIFGGAIDTAIVYNAGLAAKNAKIHDKAIAYFIKTKDNNYGGGSIYLLLEEEYKAVGDSTAALKILQEGFEKMPEDNNVLNNLINFYVFSNRAQEALEYLNIGIKREPNNATMYTALGSVYDKLNMTEKCIEAYDKSVSLDPTNFQSCFNLSVIFYNKAVALYEEAAKEMNDDKYRELVNKAEGEFKKALPYMEKALELQPNDKSSLDILKTLYYRLKMDDKYNEVMEKLKTL